MLSFSRRTRKGFTLLELIVVIVILGILAAIAIPTFASVTNKSRDASTAQTLRSLDRNAEAIAALDGGRTLPTRADYIASINELTVNGMTASAVDGAGLVGALDFAKVGVDSVSGKSGLAMRSQSGACLLLVNDGSSSTLFKSAAGTCSGNTAAKGKQATDTDVNASSGGTVVVVNPAPATLVSTFDASDVGRVGTIRTFTPEKSGVYTLEASGAQGGNSVAYAGGKGARKSVNVALTAGTSYSIIVGQAGSANQNTSNPSCTAGGGGGGSFVYQTNNSALLVAAGGGGGAFQAYGVGVGGAASSSYQDPSTDGTTGGSGGGAGALGAGGGGWLTNGVNGTYGYSYGGAASSPSGTFGSAGGQAVGGATVRTSFVYAAGGFGGGGSAGHDNCANSGGGGGGYNGGGTVNTVGNGGGSFAISSGTNVTGVSNAQTGQGKVVITWVG